MPDVTGLDITGITPPIPPPDTPEPETNYAASRFADVLTRLEALEGKVDRNHAELGGVINTAVQQLNWLVENTKNMFAGFANLTKNPGALAGIMGGMRNGNG